MDLLQKQIECIDHGYTGDSFGYQKTHYRIDGKRVCCLRHRLVYAEFNGIDLQTIKGSVVRHVCDNPRCINPEHLTLGTQVDNMRDRQLRNRQAKGMQQGLAKLTDEDVRFIRSNYIKRSKEFNTVTLGTRFGISPRNVLDIINRVTWRHI